MNRFFHLTWWVVICLFITGCNQTSKLEDVTKFSTEKKGDYLLFHLINPLKKEGYIIEVQDSGNVVYKHSITDKHFSPSDVFQYNGKFYFASGAYSNDTKVMKYNPASQKVTLIKTNQNKFIEKYYNDGDSEYIVSVIDNNSRNEVCDIKLKKCLQFSNDYMAHDVTTLDNHVIVVGVDKNATGNKEKVVLIKKLNKNLETIEETYIDFYPNYFTYTSPDQKLYLFMINGDIVEIDSNLNIHTYSMELTDIANNITNVKYNKNVSLDKDSILVNVEIQEPEKNINFLAKLSFKNGGIQMNIVEDSENEDILNVDSKSNEVFTRSYVEGKTVITIRDTKTLKVKNKLKLDNKDPIYFVDNIKK
ncbi:hypothetical protein NSQ82_17600 [Caldifermentibacillus hisashii]|uniref:hypothetical protein n=1 Tax=Caldifermentibacillus hisashii TaxID=996558 RepID=UPI001C10EF08|nr:hypothetical protein [Caldifermentibacillus hisashii]MBU5343431.1 hypothetical protein [Caldifermentibacillus hisashii]